MTTPGRNLDGIEDPATCRFCGLRLWLYPDMTWGDVHGTVRCTPSAGHLTHEPRRVSAS